MLQRERCVDARDPDECRRGGSVVENGAGA
jgi:hypothetical protein